MILIDPVNLTEPLVKSEEYYRSARELPAQTWLWVCDPVVEIATREAGEVPAYCPTSIRSKTSCPSPSTAWRSPSAEEPRRCTEFQEVLKKNPPPPPLPPPTKGATRVTGPPQGQGQGR